MGRGVTKCRCINPKVSVSRKKQRVIVGSTVERHSQQSDFLRLENIVTRIAIERVRSRTRDRNQINSVSSYATINCDRTSELRIQSINRYRVVRITPIDRYARNRGRVRKRHSCLSRDFSVDCESVVCRRSRVAQQYGIRRCRPIKNN